MVYFIAQNKEVKFCLSLLVSEQEQVRWLHCVSKNDIDVAHHNFDADQPILIIFGR